MGFFGEYLWSQGAWGSATQSEPWLSIRIEDSDIAIIEYAAVGVAGFCYLGQEPRHYYEDPTASRPVDTNAQARCLAAWAAIATGTSVKSRRVKSLLASPRGRDPKDVFVEATVDRLVVRLGLPSLPAPLP